MINNTVMYTEKFAKKGDFTLSVLIIKIRRRRRRRRKTAGRNFGNDGYVYVIDCGDGFMDVYLSPNSSSCIHQLCTTFCMWTIPQ